MTVVKTYSSRLEADLASILLRAEGIAATVVGVGLALEGGADGVRLLVPDEQADAALEVLDNL
jgi:Putative prokaryotic signal transducing protein